MAKINRNRSAPGRPADLTPPEVGPVISTRGKHTPGVPGLHAPGVPEGALKPAAQFVSPDWKDKLKHFTPAQADEIGQIIVESMHQAFDRFSLYTQSKPFDNYDVITVPILANTRIRLDRFGQYGEQGRRALMIINPDAANVLWVGKSNVNLLQGIPVVANNGTYLVSVHERAEHWGIIAGAGTIVVVWYS